MDVVPFASAAGELTLVKESWMHSDYQLEGPGGEVVAELDYGWTGKAEGRTADTAWTFSRARGFFHRDIAVTASGSEEVVASYDLKSWSRGGTVEVGGADYEVSAEGFWKPTWSLLKGGVPVVQVAETGSLGEQKARLTLVGQDPNNALLALLVVHAMVTSQREQSSGATISS